MSDTHTSSERLGRLQSVTDAALAHLDVDELLRELLDRTCELLRVDTAAVLLLDEEADVLVATAARGIEEEVTQGVRIPVGRGFAGRIAAEKRSVILDRVDHTTVLNPILRERGIKSLLGVPLLDQGAVVGVLHVGTLTSRAFGDADAELLRLVADRLGPTIVSRLARSQNVSTLALQHSLLPARLPTIGDLEFAARYVPGGTAGLGGDWYDVFLLPSGALCVVIGDVVGKGLRAAVVMGRLRSTVRAYALTASDPAEILRLVDRKFQHFEPYEMATVMVGLLDPNDGSLALSTAGHPPPLLASRHSEPYYLDLDIDAPVGVATEAKRRSTTISWPPGAVLCFYTDGLVERRTTPLDERLEALRAAVTVDPPETVCMSVMARLVGTTPPADDVALLVARRGAVAGKSPLRLTVPAKPASLRVIRSELRRWLSSVGAGTDAQYDVLLGVGEATANAVEHAYGAAVGAIEVEVTLDGDDVLAIVRDKGRWRPPRGHDRGRGSVIMRAVSDDVRVRRAPDGTEVVIRRRLRP
jgi:anti-sigma regulatory factor (Ser/Thr protein kinase)/putative methionine-R-sulfoxide reductase with GAF domain